MTDVVNLISSKFLNIAGAATTIVKSGSGSLKSVIINQAAAGTITIYDNVAGSGTKIAAFKASVTEGTYVFNCVVGIGITVVTANASSDVTITYD